ncbi:MAG: ankyrin repeat domain-containing protein, partial [Synergistaceae bacterium]|nr:ankyrin repeat domain-containing protein [Synergistaceae bacterium]
MEQADINKYRNTFLTAAGTNGDLQIKAPLDQGMPGDIMDGLGKTALIYACEHGCLEMAKLLVDAGANVNIKDVYGHTPSFYASFYGKNDVLMFLIKCGADLTVRSLRDKSLVSVANTRTTEILQTLHEHGVPLDDGGTDAVAGAVLNGYLETLKYLVAAGVEINTPDFQDETPLINSIKKGYTEITHFLINSGADIHYRNKKGDTALFFAIVQERIPETEMLIAAGADINRANDRNNRYGSYLTAAIAYKIPNMIRLLLKAGADPNFTDPDGNTAMHRAAEDGGVSVIKLLIKAGGNFHAVNAKGETPGHLLKKYSEHRNSE